MTEINWFKVAQDLGMPENERLLLRAMGMQERELFVTDFGMRKIVTITNKNKKTLDKLKGFEIECVEQSKEMDKEGYIVILAKLKKMLKGVGIYHEKI